MGRRHGERGLSLVELLVAMTILALGTLVVLSIYDESRRTYKIGENVAEQQQAVRIAFDLMVRDVRMAGFNTNPDGNKTRPDEQLEGLWDTALTLRADFDGNDPTAANVPEQSLAGGAFLSVSTGNDEIRTYVLAKPDGSSADTLTFDADTNVGQRDGVVETVSVPDVALTHDDPPYTLYRISLQDDGSLTRTPLIENVRSLRFEYYDAADSAINPIGGADTPADLASRLAVRRVAMDLEALTRDPDSRWEDVDDSDPSTRRFRKFSLDGDVTPRNLGLRGIKDEQADATPPTQPSTAPSLYPGHCGGLYVTWPANPPADETVYYRIQYTDSGGVTDWYAAKGTGAYLGGLQDGESYSVAVQAVDAAGNASPPGPVSSATTMNDVPANTPLAPTGELASSGLNGQVDLSWAPVEENLGSVFGDPAAPVIRDLAGYRVFRSTSSGFTPGLPTLLADESSVPGLLAPAFSDTMAVNCRPYYYLLTAVDECGRQSAPGAELTGNAWSDEPPEAPTNEAAVFTGASTVNIRWLDVDQDTLGASIHIEDYHVFRTAPLPQGTNPASLTSADFTLRGIANAATSYQDNGVVLNAGETLFYQVTAFDDCAPVNESAPTAPVSPVCQFSGVPEIQTPLYGDSVWGSTPVTVTVAGGTGIELYSQLQLTFTRQSNGSSTTVTLPMVGPSVTYDWDATPGGGPGAEFYQKGTWTIRADVEQYVGVGPATCVSSVSTRVTVE